MKFSFHLELVAGPELVGSLQGAGKSLYCRLVVARKTIGQTRVEVMTPLVGEPPAVSLAKDESYQVCSQLFFSFIFVFLYWYPWR